MLDPPIELLEDCLASVREQTYAEPIEHLIIDGGSKPEVLAVVNSAPGVRLVSGPDRGQSDAINKGFQRASGDLLTWLNADDALEPRAVERVLEASNASPHADWFYGHLRVREGSNVSVLEPPFPPAPELFTEGCPIPGVGTFFSRRALDRVGGELDIELDLAMDLDLWVRFIDAEIVAAYIPHVLAEFRLHRGSKTARPDLEARYREQVLVFAKHGHEDLRRRAEARLRWYVSRRDFVRHVEAGRLHEARGIAREALEETSDARLRKRVGLMIMSLAPRTARELLLRSGHWN